MALDIFTQQLQDLQGRLHILYKRANAAGQAPTDLFLPTVFKELGMSSEELQVAAEELRQQTEQIIALRQQVDAERQRYKELLEFMLDAYVVTDVSGKILEANRAAVSLLGVEQSRLESKLLVTFVPVHKRSGFRSTLAQLSGLKWMENCTISLQSPTSESFDVTAAIAPVRDSSGKLVSFRWLLRPVSAQKRSQLGPSNPQDNTTIDRQKHIYCKGDIIPVEPKALWVVRQGLVKLSTLNERGEEVLVGLLSSSMPFGFSLTDLPTYQAIALSDKVELINVPLCEFDASPQLAQSLLPQISQRLRQTECLLAISGRRHVQDRLHYLLLFLKEKFGQKVAQGTRLNMRLTHQELADACCTTRVTITRLLGGLQKQGKIAFDSQNRILFSEDWSEQYPNAS
ncbi:MAG TPA: helix-turn-helix domain-containing protein [Allocoleopsis sp.]